MPSKTRRHIRRWSEDEIQAGQEAVQHVSRARGHEQMTRTRFFSLVSERLREKYAIHRSPVAVQHAFASFAPAADSPIWKTSKSAPLPEALRADLHNIDAGRLRVYEPNTPAAVTVQLPGKPCFPPIRISDPFLPVVVLPRPAPGAARPSPTPPWLARPRPRSPPGAQITTPATPRRCTLPEAGMTEQELDDFFRPTQADVDAGWTPEPAVYSTRTSSRGLEALRTVTDHGQSVVVQNRIF